MRHSTDQRIFFMLPRVLGLVATLGCTPLLLAQQDLDKMDSTRATLEKWVETRRILSKERADGLLSREVLQDRIAIAKREIEAVRTSISGAEQSIADGDKEAAEQAEEGAVLAAGATVLGDSVPSLEKRTVELLRRLPDPIRDKVKLISQQIPAEGAETKLSVAERYRNVVAILNEVDKFNREVSVTPELRTLSDGTTAQVQTLYVGIGHAYYVTAKGDVAAIGTPSAEGWVWTAANDAAASIAEAVKMAQSNFDAKFVRLPVRIQ